MFKQPNDTRQSCKTSWMEVWPPSRSWSCDVRSARRDLRDWIFLGVWPLGCCREAQGRHRFLNTAPFGSNGSRPEARGPRDLFPQTAEHAPASGRWKRRHTLKYMMKIESTACISQSRLTTAKTSHPRNRTALGWLHRFRTDFQRWIRLFATRGQVISDESWRIDIQSSSTVRGYWWALQGPGQPSPIYANAKADYDINRFPDIVAAPYVAIALERSWADSFTWRIRVGIEEKRERKRPRAKCSELLALALAAVCSWSGRIPQKEVKEPIVEKESHHLDANGKFLCWKTIEQVPNKKALGIGTRIRGYLFSEACSPASEQLWISLGYLEEMWAGLKKLMADRQQLEELLGNMMAHDNVHGALDVGGSAGVASGGLMVAGFLFPPLFVVGAAGGGAQVAKGECFFGKTLSTYCLRELRKMQWIGAVWTIWTSSRPNGANPFDMAVEVNPRNAEQFLSMSYYGHAWCWWWATCSPSS